MPPLLGPFFFFQLDGESDSRGFTRCSNMVTPPAPSRPLLVPPTHPLELPVHKLSNSFNLPQSLLPGSANSSSFTTSCCCECGGTWDESAETANRTTDYRDELQQREGGVERGTSLKVRPLEKYFFVSPTFFCFLWTNEFHQLHRWPFITSS